MNQLVSYTSHLLNVRLIQFHCIIIALLFRLNERLQEANYVHSRNGNQQFLIITVKHINVIWKKS